MLEAYQAWGDQTSIGALVRDLYLGVADALGSRLVETPAGTVDLGGEWRWLPVYDAVGEAVGETVTLETSKEALLAHAATHGVEVDPVWEKDKVFLELLGGRRAPAAPADLPVRLPGDRPAPGAPAAARRRASSRPGT